MCIKRRFSPSRFTFCQRALPLQVCLAAKQRQYSRFNCFNLFIVSFSWSCHMQCIVVRFVCEWWSGEQILSNKYTKCNVCYDVTFVIMKTIFLCDSVSWNRIIFIVMLILKNYLTWKHLYIRFWEIIHPIWKFLPRVSKHGLDLYYNAC